MSEPIVDSVSLPIMSQSLIVPMGSLQTRTVQTWFYKLDKSGIYCPDFEIQYYLKGTYVYNYNTGIISSASATTWIEYCSLMGVWSYQMKNISTSARIAANKYSVTFSTSFQLTTTCSIPIANWPIPGFTEILGPYSGSLLALTGD